ncbi:MAG: hypothetical protein V3R78_10280 [Thermodesulfobacteriota bacterium]
MDKEQLKDIASTELFDMLVDARTDNAKLKSKITDLDKLIVIQSEDKDKLKEENEGLKSGWKDAADTLSEATEAHALTTQRLGDANKKINELEVTFHKYRLKVGLAREAQKEVTDELDRQLDTSNKRLEEYERIIKNIPIKVIAMRLREICYMSSAHDLEALRALGKEADG